MMIKFENDDTNGKWVSFFKRTVSQGLRCKKTLHCLNNSLRKTGRLKQIWWVSPNVSDDLLTKNQYFTESLPLFF